MTSTAAARNEVRRRSERAPLRASAVWLWAVLFAAAVLRTDNPLLLTVDLVILVMVVNERALSDTRWRHAFSAILAVSAVIFVSRLVVLAAIPPPAVGSRIWTLPAWQPIEGFRLGGPLSVASFVSALYDSYRLFVTVAIFGAASSMASVSDALRSLPAAVYDVGVAIAIGIAVAPFGAAALIRQQKIRRLRGRPRLRVRDWRRVLVPVLDETLDRSIGLAATLDSRGYGGSQRRSRGAAGTAALWFSLALLGFGTYEVGAGTRRWIGWSSVLCGVALVALALRSSSGGPARSRYRQIGTAAPRPGGLLRTWGPDEAAAVGGAAAYLVLSMVQIAVSPPSMELRFDPLRYPPLPLFAVIGAMAAGAAGIHFATALAPPPLMSEPPSRSAEQVAARARRWRTT